MAGSLRIISIALGKLSSPPSNACRNQRLPAPTRRHRHPRRLPHRLDPTSSQSFTTSVTADAPIAVFGALSFWWLGEHGSPSIDTSEHVWFANDQLAVRFIEEIDFDYAATDATEP